MSRVISFCCLMKDCEKGDTWAVRPHTIPRTRFNGWRRPQRGSVEARTGGEMRPAGEAIAVENRVEGLIELDVAALQRPAQHALLNGADFSERAVAAPVQHRGASLEPPDAKRLECEVEHELGALPEHPGTPESRSERESPFRE